MQLRQVIKILFMEPGNIALSQDLPCSHNEIVIPAPKQANARSSSSKLHGSRSVIWLVLISILHSIISRLISDDAFHLVQAQPQTRTQGYSWYPRWHSVAWVKMLNRLSIPVLYSYHSRESRNIYCDRMTVYTMRRQAKSSTDIAASQTGRQIQSK